MIYVSYGIWFVYIGIRNFKSFSRFVFALYFFHRIVKITIQLNEFLGRIKRTYLHQMDSFRIIVLATAAAAAAACEFWFADIIHIVYICTSAVHGLCVNIEHWTRNMKTPIYTRLTLSSILYFFHIYEMSNNCKQHQQQQQWHDNGVRMTFHLNLKFQMIFHSCMYLKIICNR